MCGINLIIDKNNYLGAAAIQKMARATHHRGPEHNDIVEIDGKPKIFLGHNRLKIIERSNGANQPFVSPCKRYFLIYNGEIYNFLDLRNQLLDQGILFTTYSDTEVLMHLMISKGESALSLLEGMFSFIFYDKESSLVTMARDRNGIKPLFYYHDENYIIASSETKGILASGLISKSLNEKQIFHYLKYRYANSPETFFEGIYHVAPGSYISIYKDKIINKASFEPNAENPEKTSLSKAQIISKTEELIIDALTNQIVADVPVGLFLSGGVDSTLILALMQHSGIPMVPSFSIVHKKKEKSFGTDDYIFAKEAAAQYGSYHYSIAVDIEDLNAFDGFIQDLDQPIGDSAAFLTYKLSYEAKKNVGVVLSGAGADEVFAGYHRHRAFQKYLENYNLIKGYSPLLKKLLQIMPSGFDHPLRKHFQLGKKFARNYSELPGKTFANFTSLNIPGIAFTENYPAFKDPNDIEGNLMAALEFDKE
nr:asparagine synthase (glutamine-hydrolyzing) [Bacteroidota bacterium]